MISARKFPSSKYTNNGRSPSRMYTCCSELVFLPSIFHNIVPRCKCSAVVQTTSICFHSVLVTEITFTVVSLVLTLFSQSDNSLRYLKDLTANVLQIGDKLKGETGQQNDMWCHFGTMIFKNVEKGLFFSIH